MAESLSSESPFKWKNIPKLFGLRLEEEPRFYVVLKDHHIQIRKYRPFLMAQVIVKGPFEKAVLVGFLRLHRFLSGENSTQERMPMTMPVFESKGEGDASTWVVSFIMPHQYTFASLPQPLDSHIKIKKVPASLVATLRFSGTLTEVLVDEKSLELSQWLDHQDDYVPASKVQLAQYDAPYVIPYFKRNEVHITLNPVSHHRKSH